MARELDHLRRVDAVFEKITYETVAQIVEAKLPEAESFQNAFIFSRRISGRHKSVGNIGRNDKFSAPRQRRHKLAQLSAKWDTALLKRFCSETLFVANVDKTLLKVHVIPLKVENFAPAHPGVKADHNHRTKILSESYQHGLDLILTHNPGPLLRLLEEIYSGSWVVFNSPVPDGEGEGAAKCLQISIYRSGLGAAGVEAPPLKLLDCLAGYLRKKGYSLFVAKLYEKA